MKSRYYLKALTISLLAASTLGFRAHQAVGEHEAFLPVVFQQPDYQGEGKRGGDRQDGGSRGDCLPAGAELQALVPMEQTFVEIAPGVEVVDRTSVWGETLSDAPTLWLTVSEPIPNASIEAQLRTAEGEILYRNKTALPEAVGTVPVPLPPGSLPEVGALYQWTVFVNAACGEEDSETLAVEGWMLRADVSEAVSQRLQTAMPKETVTLYAQSGLWFDTLSLLMVLSQANPDDEQLSTAITQLLEAEDLMLPASNSLLSE